MEKGTSARRRVRARRKAEAVLRLLRGEAGLAPRPDRESVEARRFTAKIGELSMENELLREKIARMEAGRP